MVAAVAEVASTIDTHAAMAPAPAAANAMRFTGLAFGLLMVVALLTFVGGGGARQAHRFDEPRWQDATGNLPETSTPLNRDNPGQGLLTACYMPA
ncbi:hypothetical protein Pa4123_78260 [Phytohabitans aurantiacus]|uniref:Uncharacterized protein n=1 Tax=Phytohabitans aurantiacus TaxID=3016789 RepID=A0ABQ5R831_9ACTN|nr:hypothetical protein Pa4123_78260 [Phytohabitans aurantiacus]